MKVDLSGAELFLAYLAGSVSGDELLQHLAYCHVTGGPEVGQGVGVIRGDPDAAEPAVADQLVIKKKVMTVRARREGSAIAPASRVVSPDFFRCMFCVF
jgi:hypothetical protein